MNKPSEKEVAAGVAAYERLIEKSVTEPDDRTRVTTILSAAALARAEDGEGREPNWWLDPEDRIALTSEEVAGQDTSDLIALYTHAPQPSGPVEALEAAANDLDAMAQNCLDAGDEAQARGLLAAVSHLRGGRIGFFTSSHPSPQPSGPVEVREELTGFLREILVDSYDISAEVFDNDVELYEAITKFAVALTSSKPDAPQAVPSGWKLVPEDADDAMVRAAIDVDWSGGDGNEAAVVHNLWHAMLSASPAAPTAGGEDD